MSAIGRFFVCAKHWQVFALMLGLVCIAEIIALRWTLPGEGEWTTGFLPLFLSTELCAICYATWFWSVGTFVNSAVRSEFRLSMTMFRVCVVFPCVYMALFDVQFYSPKPALSFAFLPLHLFALYSMFYDLYFVSKALVLAERAGDAEFPHYMGTMLLIWFFPLGVWFIQPRINRLAAGTLERQTA